MGDDDEHLEVRTANDGGLSLHHDHNANVVVVPA